MYLKRRQSRSGSCPQPCVGIVAARGGGLGSLSAAGAEVGLFGPAFLVKGALGWWFTRGFAICRLRRGSAAPAPASPAPSRGCFWFPPPAMDFPQHSQQVLEQLNQQRQLGLLCDCTFVVNGIDFKAHKAVLAACSEYFRMLFVDQKDVVHLDISNAAGRRRVGR